MKLHSRLVMVGLLSLGLFSYSCANGDTVSGTTGGGTGNGGSNSTGTGGSSSTGTGGTHTGGSTGTGGFVTTGTGGTHTGGSTGTGGIRGTGGITTSGTGGTIVTGTGGITTTGTGGTTTTSCSSFGVTAAGFVSMPAVGGGCWSGFASDGGDAGSTIAPGAFSTCGMPCMLTMTGMLNASVSPNYAGYSYLGFNIGQDSVGGAAMTVTPQGSGLTVTFTNTSNAPTVRVALNADAAGTTSYCAAVTSSPATIKYSAFTEQCYNATPGPAYAKTPIISVQLSVPGGATTAPVNITLVSVVENP
ncbi:MAG TPA: hypothetical protein VLC06_27760 [Polyangia bacterium]|nr:hypothetical protein [Polyangia bacterium]